MIVRILKRHTFFLLSCCCVLVAAGLVGYGLSCTATTLANVNLPATNSPAFLIARFTVYTVLFLFWEPLLRKVKGINTKGANVKRTNVKGDLPNGHRLQMPSYMHTRQWVMVSALLYELLLVQNVLAVLIKAFV